MTGAGAFYGQQMSRGMILAVEEINASGGVDGIPFELYIEDHHHGDPKAGLSGFQRLRSLYNIPVATTSYTAPSLAIQAFVEAAPADEKCLLLQGGAWSPKLMRHPYLYNFRLVGNTLVIGMLDYTWNVLGVRKMAQLYASEPASTDSAKLAKMMWEDLGGEVVAEEVAPKDATDFRSQIAKIKAKNPDVLTLWWCGETHAVQLKQAYEAGLHIPTIGFDFNMENHPKLIPEAMEYYYRVADEFLPSLITSETGKRFISLYESKNYEKAPSPEIYAANYYDMVYVAKDCILKAKEQGGDYYTGEKLTQALEEIKTFPSVYGQIVVDLEEHGCYKDFYIMQWELDKNEYKLIKTIPAAEVSALYAKAVEYMK